MLLLFSVFYFTVNILELTSYLSYSLSCFVVVGSEELYNKDGVQVCKLPSGGQETKVVELFSCVL